MRIKLICYKRCVIDDNLYNVGDVVMADINNLGLISVEPSKKVYSHNYSVADISQYFCTEEDKSDHFADVGKMLMYDANRNVIMAFDKAVVAYEG